MKLTDQQKIEIVKKYQSGSSSNKLAQEYGITKQGILCILRVRNVEIRTKKKK